MVVPKERFAGVTVMGAISNQFNNKALFVQVKGTTTEEMVNFLPKLRAKFPLHRTTRIKLVLDGA